MERFLLTRLRLKQCGAIGILLFSLLFFSSLKLSAQDRLIKGTVVDDETGVPIPMVNVFIKGTTIGCTTDDMGFFEFFIPKRTDSLCFSSIGYRMQALTPQRIDKKATIKLMPDVISLNEIDVAPDDSQVRMIVKNMVKAREKNDPNRYDRQTFKKYTRRKFNINNADSTLMKMKMFQDHLNAFKKNEDGKHYLPVYMSEQVFENDFQRDPKRQKSTMVADKTVGLGFLGEMDVAGFSNGLDHGFGFYENIIRLFGENFISPTSSAGWSFYKYYLEDSVMRNGVKHYKILFVPRRKRDKVFRGRMIIENKNYSLVCVEAKLSTNSNMTFLKDLELKMKYKPVNDTASFYESSVLKAKFDYNLIELPTSSNSFEIDHEKYTNYYDVILDNPNEVTLSADNISFETIKTKSAALQDSSFWSNNRPPDMTLAVANNYAAIDSVNQLKGVKVFDNASRMFMNGYYDVGKVELGPYIDFISYNKVEGIRPFFGMRTSSEISDRWMLFGGAAYGTRTEKFSGSLGGGYKFEGPKRKIAMLRFDDAYTRIGENGKILYLKENKLSPNESNLVAALFTLRPFIALHRQQSVKLLYENEWRTGFSTKFRADWGRQFSPEYYPFIYKGNEISSFSYTDASLNFRWSWKEKVIDDEFMRLYAGTQHPIIHLVIGGGNVYYADRNDWYAKVSTVFNHHFPLGPTDFRYALEAGMYHGNLPYCMLEIPRANETLGYFIYDFNLMNNMEYVHDKYAHLFIDYHLKGYFTNRVPFFRALGFKEVLSAKLAVGSLDRDKYDSFDIPEELSTLSTQPYVEVGAGFANIFKLLRVEGVWRVSPESQVGAPKFGIRFRVHLEL